MQVACIQDMPSSFELIVLSGIHLCNAKHCVSMSMVRQLIGSPVGLPVSSPHVEACLHEAGYEGCKGHSHKATIEHGQRWNCLGPCDAGLKENNDNKALVKPNVRLNGNHTEK